MSKTKTAANAFIDLVTPNKPKTPPLVAAKEAGQSTPPYTPVYQTKDLGGLDPIYFADMSAHLGKMLNTNPWDVMSRNQQIESVSSKPVQDTIVTHGGQAYPRDTAHIAQGIGGASNEGIAKRVQGRFDIASQEGIDLGGTGEVLASPHTMTDSSVNFAMPVTDLYRSFFNRLATPEQFQQLTDELRSKIITTKNSKTGEVTVKKPYADIPNLDDPAIDKWFSDVPEFRKEFLSRMQNTKKWSEMVGLNPKDVLAAFKDENLIGVPPQYMGHTLIEAVPGAPIQPSKNATYSHDTLGGYRGSAENTPVPIMLNKPFSEVAQEIRAKWPDAPREDIAKWATGALGSREKGISEMITPEMLRRIEDYHVGLKQDKFPPNDIGAALDYLDLPKFADGGMVDSVPEEAIKNTVRDPQAARLLDLDLAKYALMNQPQRMAGGGTMKKIAKPAVNAVMLRANQFDTSHFDPVIVQRAKKYFGDTSKLSDAEYQQALAERANQYRIESILSSQGFDTSGYSNLSGSSYHNKMVGTEYDPKYGWVEKDTHQVRLANHPDYHPPMAEDVKQRFNINHSVEPSTWEDYHISPNMNDEQVYKILSGLDIPNEPSITKAHGGAVRMAQGGQVLSEAIGGQVQTPVQGDMGKMTFDQYRTSIGMHEGGRHMAGGGQVQRFDEGGQVSQDQMRYELSNSPVMQATPRSPMQDLIGTAGGYMDRAGKFVSEAIEPIAEKHPVKTFLANMFLADPLKSAGTLMQDLTGTVRETDEDNPVRGVISKDWKNLTTSREPLLDPRALDLAGFATPVVKGVTKLAGAGAKAITPFAKSTAEMAAELYGTGKMPMMVAPNAYMAEPPIPKPAKALAPANEQGFYSPTEAAALNLQRKTGNGQAFLNDLLKQENVRSEEISGMGLDTFLKEKKNVTAAEVQDYIAQNKLGLSETVYGGKAKGNFLEFLKEKGYPDDEALRILNKAEDGNMDSQVSALRNEYLDSDVKPTKFKEYSLPGGENYREIVLTLPKVDETSISDSIAKLNRRIEIQREIANDFTAEGNLYLAERANAKANQAELELNQLKEKPAPRHGNYRNEAHWGYLDNPLAHLRMSDRVTDGKKTLLVDEVQSDWHQAGREQGYKTEESAVAKKAYGDYAGDLEKRYVAAIREEAPSVYLASDAADLENYVRKTVNQKSLNDMAKALGEQDKYQQLYKDYNIEIGQNKKGVPNAPYKEDWYQLALRRAVKEAIDGGYDRVALPTGARVAERFDLSKQIDRIDYNKNPDGTYSMSAIKDGSEVFAKEGLDEKELSGLVGKDVTKKIVGDEGSSAPKADRWEAEDGDVPEFKSLSGLDLQVGGEGMKKYYDEIYPGYLKKFGKKYGATVGDTTVKHQQFGAPEPLHYMDITPAMRKEFSTGIHMAKGGKVSFAKSADDMRKELLRNKHG